MEQGSKTYVDNTHMVTARIKYYDGLKFFAIFLVYMCHFIAYIDESLFRYWREFPSWLVLKGLSGKFGVALFGVLMCRLAYDSGKKRRYSMPQYMIRRYLFFVLYGFVINIIYLIYYSVKAKALAFNIVYVLRVTLMLEPEIFPTFWCMQASFLSSVMAYLLGYSHTRGGGGQNILGRVLLIFAFLISRNLWVAICLMGTLIPDIEDKRSVWEKKWTKHILIVAFFIFIKKDESDMAYFLDGICSVLLILLVEGSKFLKKILSNHVVSKMGTQTMAILIIHVLGYQLVGAWLMQLFICIPYKMAFMFSFVLCFAIIVMISWPLTEFLNRVYKRLNSEINKIVVKLDRRFI